jgi:hypothetical protein
VRSKVALGYSKYQDGAARKPLDRLHLKPTDSRLNPVSNRVLKPQNLGIEVNGPKPRDALWDAGRLSALTTLRDSQDDITASGIGQCRHIGQELFAVVSGQTREFVLVIEGAAFLDLVREEGLDRALINLLEWDVNHGLP